MLQVVDALVLQRDVEQRREVADPEHAPRTISQATTGMREHAETRVEWRIGRSTRRRRSGEAARSSWVIGAASAISGGATSSQQQVLDHVHREQRRVVALDART